MCVTDEYPTEYDIDCITEADNPNNFSITDTEQKALECIDIAEAILKPVDIFCFTKLLIKTSAYLARIHRNKS